MRYIKKPVEIEAIQFTGENKTAIEEFVGDKGKWCCNAKQTKVWMKLTVLGGTVRVDKGDFIIRGVKGEYYPCKPDIFQQTYELIEP